MEGASASDDELADAETAVQQVEGGKAKQRSLLTVFIEVATLIFLAEWGDRCVWDKQRVSGRMGDNNLQTYRGV